MTQLKQIYKCNICGNIVEVVQEGAGQLVCCGQPMIWQQENTVDAAYEKHIPVVEKTEKGIRVKVGSQPHPMSQEHFIEWIEIIANEKISRKFLGVNSVPEAEFETEDKNVIARAFCNLHGLWKN